MIEIAVCDDNASVVAGIEALLGDLASSRAVEIEIDVFYDGSNLSKHIENGKRYDIIYLDIEMKKENGVDTGRHIREYDENVLIIYVTSHENFAKEVFEVAAYRFITKPIKTEQFTRYFNDAINQLIKMPVYFQYQYNKVSYRIRLDEIIYFQSDMRVTYIVTSSETRKCYERLNNIENKLVKSDIFFYRTHQSFLINPKYVSVYMYDYMTLQDGTTIGISNSRRKRVNELYCKIKGDDIIV